MSNISKKYRMSRGFSVSFLGVIIFVCFLCVLIYRISEDFDILAAFRQRSFSIENLKKKRRVHSLHLDTLLIEFFTQLSVSAPTQRKRYSFFVSVAFINNHSEAKRHERRCRYRYN